MLLVVVLPCWVRVGRLTANNPHFPESCHANWHARVIHVEKITSTLSEIESSDKLSHFLLTWRNAPETIPRVTLSLALIIISTTIHT